jgi:hypothetical protein
MQKTDRRLLYTIAAITWLLIVNAVFFYRRLAESDFLATITGLLWRH